MNPLSLIPFPIKIIAGLLIAASLTYGGWYARGVIADRDAEKVQIEAQKQLLEQKDLVAQYTQAAQTIANHAEEESNAKQKQHNAEIAHYRNLVNQRGGLFDNHSQNTTNNSPTTGSSTSTETTASGTRLSEEATGFLLDQANRADQVVDQYLTCQKYITSLTDYITQTLKGTK